MGKQFIERSPVIIGVLSAIAILLVLFFSLTVSREDLSGGYVLTVEFADANGLAAGDIAMVAGIQAGKVTDVEIVGDRIEATVQMQGNVQLPTTTRASITLRTLVGKKAIDLDTGTDFSGPFLEDDDTIGLENTQVVLDVPDLAESAEDLLTEIDSDALNTLLVAVADVTRDQRDEVATLIDSGTDLTELVNSQEQQIRLLLRNLSSVAQTLQSRDDQLVGVIDDLDVAMGNIAARRGELQALLRETQSTSAVTADFVVRVRGDLDEVLDELELDLEIVRRHQLDIAEALAYFGDSIVGYSSIAFADQTPVPWGHVLVTSAGPVGLDVLTGCGGLLDQQLDQVLGPDPRSCEEQGVTGTPDSQDPPGPNGGGDEDPAIPDLPVRSGADVPLPDGTLNLAPEAFSIDTGPRSYVELLMQQAGAQQ